MRSKKVTKCIAILGEFHLSAISRSVDQTEGVELKLGATLCGRKLTNNLVFPRELEQTLHN